MTQPVIELRPATAQDTEAVLALELESRDFFRSIIGDYEDSYYNLASVEKSLKEAEALCQSDKSYQYLIWQSHTLIGRVNLRNVARRHVNSAHLGARISKHHAGRGIGSFGLGLLIDEAFGNLGLWRIETSIVPHNIASHAVVAKHGFIKFGHSKSSFCLDNTWHDLIYYELHKTKRT